MSAQKKRLTFSACSGKQQIQQQNGLETGGQKSPVYQEKVGKISIYEKISIK